jgi:tetratricopeptide (TPR) repeat protein
MAEGLIRTPGDEQSWIVRAIFLAPSKPVAALADLDQALKLNPLSRSALKNKAYVYSGPLKGQLLQSVMSLDQVSQFYPVNAVPLSLRKTLLTQLFQEQKWDQEAVKCLDRVMELFPEDAHTLSDRGVLHARVGNRKLAVLDAETALALDQDGMILYKAGCIYGLTSKKHPEDQGPALKHLADALREGFGAELLAADPDLNALRHLPDFKKLLAAAAALSK